MCAQSAANPQSAKRADEVNHIGIGIRYGA
jgi:hypothetical protein